MSVKLLTLLCASLAIHGAISLTEGAPIEEAGGSTKGAACFAKFLLHGPTRLKRVTCRSEPFWLVPGEVLATDQLRVISPYPTQGLFELLEVQVNLLDEDINSVPLDEAYVHHLDGAYQFFSRQGSDYRHHELSEPLPDGYAVIVNASAPMNTNATAVVMSLVGVPDDRISKCRECWCEDEVDNQGRPVSHASCCSSDTCNSTRSHEPARKYYIAYEVTYRPLQPETKHVIAVNVPVRLHEDVYADSNGTHMLEETLSFATLSRNKSQSVTILKCVAHQHIGGLCMQAYDAVTGNSICQSCPVYGTEQGAAGNEEGFVVSHTQDHPAYELPIDHPIRVVSMYNTSETHLGTMSLFRFYIGGIDQEDFAGEEKATFYQALIDNGNTTYATHMMPDDLKAYGGIFWQRATGTEPITYAVRMRNEDPQAYGGIHWQRYHEGK